MRVDAGPAGGSVNSGMSRRSGSKFQLQGILEVVDFVRVFFNSFVS